MKQWKVLMRLRGQTSIYIFYNYIENVFIMCLHVWTFLSDREEFLIRKRTLMKWGWLLLNSSSEKQRKLPLIPKRNAKRYFVMPFIKYIFIVFRLALSLKVSKKLAATEADSERAKKRTELAEKWLFLLICFNNRLHLIIMDYGFLQKIKKINSWIGHRKSKELQNEMRSMSSKLREMQTKIEKVLIDVVCKQLWFILITFRQNF